MSTKPIGRWFRVRTLAAVVPALLAAAGCSQVDKAFCSGGNCGWSDVETQKLEALSGLPDAPPADTTNVYLGRQPAIDLGRKFFWDARFSGVSTGTDSLKRPMPYGRAPKGQPLNISCATCHNLRRGGIDTTSFPSNVSLGASWDTVNAPTVFNDAYRPLVTWAGRVDSLWAQPPGSIEGSLGSTRLRAAWTIATYYHDDYQAVFPDYPLPMSGTINDISPTLQSSGAQAGQCTMTSSCPSGCRSVTDSTGTMTGCFPRFPLDGKPGNKAGCQPGDATEPFGDAWDCMDPADQQSILRVVVNFGKAIAAFETQLTTNHSPFDQFVDDLRAGNADQSEAISPSAKNGARLFVGKAGCSECHNGPLLTDEGFHNVGIPQEGAGVPTMDDCPKGGICDCVTPKNCIPSGAVDGNVKLRGNAYLRTSTWSDDPTDASRAKYFDDAYTNTIAMGSWRTPSLRDVALTAPYMHTGAFATLEDVVAHYNKGSGPMSNGVPDARITPLFLTDQEQADLVEFLKSLTGEPLPSSIADPPQLP